eukprot:SAG25_NODE_8345_length_426_cov_1.174312_2_plen_98_part_01
MTPDREPHYDTDRIIGTQDQDRQGPAFTPGAAPRQQALIDKQDSLKDMLAKNTEMYVAFMGDAATGSAIGKVLDVSAQDRVGELAICNALEEKQTAHL